MEELKQAVDRYASRHANADGLARSPVAGVHMMRVTAPSVELHSVYHPLVCLVLQGSKQLRVGREERLVSGGQTVIVSADMPVLGRVLRASGAEPYLAVAVELENALLRELALGLDEPHRARAAEAAPLPSAQGLGSGSGAATRARFSGALSTEALSTEALSTEALSTEPLPTTEPLFTENSEDATLDCVARLLRLQDRPQAIPLLRPAILRELHYWLLSGRHGAALRRLADPDSQAGRLAAAIAVLRRDFREPLPVQRLAAAAAMGQTAFHRHFKRLTSLTPGQFQKRLRLIEARRLLLEEGAAASQAAYAVGYESVSQFTRDYRRLFQLPPKRDALRQRQQAPASATSLPAAPAAGSARG